jgi:hypothetical protein
MCGWGSSCCAVAQARRRKNRPRSCRAAEQQPFRLQGPTASRSIGEGGSHPTQYSDFGILSHCIALRQIGDKAPPSISPIPPAPKGGRNRWRVLSQTSYFVVSDALRREAGRRLSSGVRFCSLAGCIVANYSENGRIRAVNGSISFIALSAVLPVQLSSACFTCANAACCPYT